MTNPGGIRTDIDKKGDGTVSYADVFASQPFRNQLITLTLTGAQIKAGAGAAMDGSKAAAHPAGLERLQLCLGRHETIRRARRCRAR